MNRLAASGSVSNFVVCQAIALEIISSSSSVGFDRTVVSLKFLFMPLASFAFPFLFSGSSGGNKAFLVMACLASAPGGVEYDERFYPCDTGDLNV